MSQLESNDSYQNPVDGNVYISPALESFGDPTRKVRIVTKAIDSEETYAFAQIKDEVVLRRTSGGNKEIRVKFFEDNRGIFNINIQGYNPATEKPHNASFTFIGDEIPALFDFFAKIKTMPLYSSGAFKITDDELSKLCLTNNQLAEVYKKHHELFNTLVRNEITNEDIVAIGYRKKQLEFFHRLLTEPSYFETVKNKMSLSAEDIWQRFFEKNTWIFGYGLGYVFLTGLDDKKLEQTVQGFDVNTSGKRVDALMKTRGIISNLCFVEIKTHLTDLLSTNSYRSGCWSASKELAGAIAQVQGTVSAAVDSLKSKFVPTDSAGNPTGEEIYNYQPKSYLVIGNLNEFTTENGVNSDKLRSFELLRKNIYNPEIITFDELYERARFIVENNDKR